MNQNMIKALAALPRSKDRVSSQEVGEFTGLRSKQVETALYDLYEAGLAKKLKKKEEWSLSAKGHKVVQAIRDSF